jgi:hypothetical protein
MKKRFRDLLFIGLVLAGALALHASLFPLKAAREPKFDPQRPEKTGITAVARQVDAAFTQNWSELGLESAPRADDLTLLRRLQLALVGSVPSLQEIRRFEAYQGPERIQWWLEQVLHDRRFSDYFAERLARSYVGTEDGPFIIYRRRRFVSWLSDQVLANRPYDQVVREMIAGQGLFTDNPATNFLTVAFENNNDGSPNRPNPERVAGRVARAFLGLRLDCAQCHNDYISDRWKQTDFQALAAFFGGTRLGFTGLYDDAAADYRYENRKTGERVPIQPTVPFAGDLLADQGNHRQRLADWVTDRQNPYFARAMVQRTWALLFGKPMLDAVESVAPIDQPPAYLEALADDFTAHGYDIQRLIRVIVASRIFQLDSAAAFEITSNHEAYWAVFPMTRLRPEQVSGGVLQAASLVTINYDSNIITRITRAVGVNQFVERYGDTGEDEFANRAVTIPQTLLLLNGELVKEKTRPALQNAATHIAQLAPDDAKAIEAAYLAVLTRRPTPPEAEHFQALLAGARGDERSRRLEDVCWALINSTEFSWNH